jgi:hypothetical protein
MGLLGTDVPVLEAQLRDDGTFHLGAVSRRWWLGSRGGTDLRLLPGVVQLGCDA